MPRQARLDAPGILQHVMLRGIEKGLIFHDEKDRNNFLERMGDLAEETDTQIYAWSLMANHVHILLRTGPMGLPRYMRRLLTGYAISFNRRHSRHGYLFQDRYKSIVCDEDNYFRELIRYIHLNPIRAKGVTSIALLDRYPWCGHAGLVGNIKQPWQDREYVLSWFGTKNNAQKAYHRYVNEGVSREGQIESTEGQLLKALGNGVAGTGLQPTENQDSTDRRILGNEDFAAKIRREIVHEIENNRLPPSKMRQEIQKMIEERCEQEGINLRQLRMGSRRHPIGKVRSDIAWKLAIQLGLPSVEIGHQLGISPSAVSKILQRRSR
jgi:putative transposase